MKSRSLRRVAIVGVLSALASVSAIAGTAQAAPAPSRVTLTSTTPNAVPGQGVKLKAVVKPVTGSGIPTGSVTFNEGVAVLGTGALVVANGVATAKITVAGLAFGAHSITATYAGGTAYATSTSLTLVVNVTKAASTTTILAKAKTPAGRYTFTASARLTLPSTGIATGVMTFVVDGGAPQLVALNAFGKAPLTVAFVVGTVHTVAATYGGDSSVATSTGTFTSTA